MYKKSQFLIVSEFSWGSRSVMDQLAKTLCLIQNSYWKNIYPKNITAW